MVDSVFVLYAIWHLVSARLNAGCHGNVMAQAKQELFWRMAPQSALLRSRGRIRSYKGFGLSN
jgi:hypothetical protein